MRLTNIIESMKMCRLLQKNVENTPFIRDRVFLILSSFVETVQISSTSSFKELKLILTHLMNDFKPLKSRSIRATPGTPAGRLPVPCIGGLHGSRRYIIIIIKRTNADF